MRAAVRNRRPSRAREESRPAEGPGTPAAHQNPPPTSGPPPPILGKRLFTVLL